MVNRPPLDRVIDTMLRLLGETITAPVLIDGHVSVVAMDERSPGFGARIGNVTMGAFGSVAVGAIWLEGSVRFEVHSNDETSVTAAAGELHGRLMKAKSDLRIQGFLAIRLLETSIAISPPTKSGKWHKHAVYHLLYEYRFLDRDAAEYLVLRIPIDTDNEDESNREASIVSGGLQRWDETSAPNLSLRGPRRIQRLALSIHGNSDPTGSVTLLRTYEGATGLPASASNLEGFLGLLNHPVSPEKHAALKWQSVTGFLNELTPEGGPIAFFDPENPSLPYVRSYARAFGDTPILLAEPGDRLEIYYAKSQPNEPDQELGTPAVIYLRAT